MILHTEQRNTWFLTNKIVLGKYYLKVWSNPGIQDRQIEKIIVHQRYNSHTFSNDIAILKLNQPADITDFVRPVCLWNELNHLESVIAKQGMKIKDNSNSAKLI